MEPILNVKNLTMNFGGLKALDSVSLSVEKGQIAALIGPNGAGKTTFANCITGIYPPTKGLVEITPPGKPTHKLNGLKTNIVTERGLARTFQNIRLFKGMTVLENVMIGRHCRLKSGIIKAMLRPSSQRNEETKAVDDSYEILEKIGLEKYVNEMAVNLPYGMNPHETRELDELIVWLRDNEDLSILLIEHDMKLVMSLSDKIHVVDYGKKIAEGTPEQVKSNPEVIKAYLGDDSEDA
jgi:branched-chain amino acid transport system ATP-binding protein